MFIHQCKITVLGLVLAKYFLSKSLLNLHFTFEATCFYHGTYCIVLQSPVHCLQHWGHRGMTPFQYC